MSSLRLAKKGRLVLFTFISWKRQIFIAEKYGQSQTLTEKKEMFILSHVTTEMNTEMRCFELHDFLSS